ncbi:hypothetical protein JG688_00017196 [Phytophthora aleatoria]|uniref:DUF6818 domain-containing protein n=1 Tax=Phytophthora aleatoria TaxID=2496075 RepID=A0A8J5MCC6_9STRA|nr:hypothetical protein JG688_00017196 [Phytophthora aleatoria]
MALGSLLLAVKAWATGLCRRRLPESLEELLHKSTLQKVCHRDVLHNRMDVVIKLTMSLKMTKKQGSTNYTYAGQRRLLEIVQAILPTCKTGWEVVTAAYNATETTSWNRRGCISLRRKFTSLNEEYKDAQAPRVDPPQLATDAKMARVLIQRRVYQDNNQVLSYWGGCLALRYSTASLRTDDIQHGNTIKSF